MELRLTVTHVTGHCFTVYGTAQYGFIYGDRKPVGRVRLVLRCARDVCPLTVSTVTVGLGLGGFGTDPKG